MIQLDCRNHKNFFHFFSHWKTNFPHDFCLFTTRRGGEQDEVESKMDEVANDSSDFVGYRTEEAHTQARRLVPQTLFHQTNTGDSSRSLTAVSCSVRSGSLLGWLDILICFLLLFLSPIRRLLKIPARKDPIRIRLCGGENDTRSLPAQLSIRTKTFISIG